MLGLVLKSLTTEQFGSVCSVLVQFRIFAHCWPAVLWRHFLTNSVLQNIIVLFSKKYYPGGQIVQVVVVLQGKFNLQQNTVAEEGATGRLGCGRSYNSSKKLRKPQVVT